MNTSPDPSGSAGPAGAPSKAEASAKFDEAAETTPPAPVGETVPCPKANRGTTTSTEAPSYFINQPGYATGDQFGIAATLILDKSARVLVTTNKDKDKDPTDRGPAIVAFYNESGVGDQVTLVPVDDIRAGTKSKKDLLKAMDGLLLGSVSNTQKNKMLKGVGEGTDRVAAEFGAVSDTAEKRKKLRDAFGVSDTSKDEQIGKWLEQKGITPEKKQPVVILWSRFSGKKGDIHIEHDTSFKGMDQLAERAASSGAPVIIAGDPPMPRADKPDRAKKYDEIAEKHPGKVHNLTGFWTENPAWSQTRNDQFKLYDHLDRNSAGAKHLGFRSGNLEAMALMGHEVRYMEEPNSIGGERMEKWHDKGIGYDRITVDKPPTRSGKYLKEDWKTFEENNKDAKGKPLPLPDEKKRPDWAPGKRENAAQKPPQISEPDKFEKGFTERDLAKVDEYFAPQRTPR